MVLIVKSYSHEDLFNKVHIVEPLPVFEVSNDFQKIENSPEL